MARKPILSQRDTQHFRIISILTKLDQGATLHTAPLAKEYNVSTRAIQRDFETIEACGYDIEGVGKGGRKFAPGFNLSRAKIGVEQQAALVMLNQLAKNMGAELHRSFQGMLEKLTGCRPDKLEQYVVPVMPVNKARPKNTVELMEKIEDSIAYRRLLDITYLPPGKTETISRRLGPLRLLVTEGATYVMGQREDPPHYLAIYRLDRIKTCEPVPGAEKPSGYSAWGRKKKSAPAQAPSAYFTPREDAQAIIDAAHNIWGVMEPRKKNIPIKLKVSGWAHCYFRDQQLVAGQKTSPGPNSSLIFEGRIGHLMEIVPHILRWLPDVTVISPPALKEEVDSRVRQYLNPSSRH